MTSRDWEKETEKLLRHRCLSGWSGGFLLGVVVNVVLVDSGGRYPVGVFKNCFYLEIPVFGYVISASGSYGSN